MQSANQELQVVVFKEKLYSSMRCFSSFLSCWQQLPKQLTSIQDLTEHHSCSSGEKIQRFCSPDREEKNEANNLLNPAVRNSGKAQNYPRQQACCTSASSAQPVPWLLRNDFEPAGFATLQKSPGAGELTVVPTWWLLSIPSEKSGFCIHTKGVTGLKHPLPSPIPAVKLNTDEAGSQQALMKARQPGTAIQRKPGKADWTIQLGKGKMMMMGG